ncbi:MAG: iron ABC transporter permease [Actinomycetota bacterium]|nr:iron ABC transporter permease [Actinomycetota bacterium]
MRQLRARAGIAALAAVPLVVLGVFFVLPVGGMIHRGFWPDGSFAPARVLSVLGRPRVGRVLWFTVWSAGAATVVSVVLGVPLAYLAHRLEFPGRAVLRALVLVPFVLPTVVIGVAFHQLLGAAGPLGGLGLDGTPTEIVAAMVFFNLGVVVRTVGSFWEGIDPRQQEAAAALGAAPWRVFTTVTLPTLLPGIVAGASVVFLFCATAFGVVLTLGGLRYSNVETEIYLLTTQQLDLPAAAALSLLQILVITGLLLLAHRARRDVPPIDRGDTRRHRVSGRDLPVVCLAAVVVGFLLVPLVNLGLASLRDASGWGLGNYRALSSVSGDALLVSVTDALRTSVLYAGYAAVLSMTMGMLVSFLVSRPRRTRFGRRLTGAFDGLFMLPLGVSAVTLGFGFLITLDRPPLDLRTSWVLIPVAQSLVALPLVVRTLAPVLSSVDDRQRQAAASLGASPGQVLLAIDLPLVWRPLLAATGFAFAVSLGEFGATSFLARSDNPTLPVVIYQLLGHPGQQNLGMAMAASAILAAATAGVALLIDRPRAAALGVL